MNILFLDMDGVVNKGQDNAKPDRYPYDDEWSNPAQKYDLFYVDPTLGSRVSALCDDYNLSIVSSSSWRKLFDNQDTFKRLLDSRFLPGSRLIGYTPSFSTGVRSDEIRYFVKNSIFDIDLYVILDDDSDAAYNSDKGRFFKTDFRSGYTEKIDIRVRKWLDSRLSSR